MAAGVSETFVHGTAVAIGDRAALLRGAPGSGKSDLALRAIAIACNGAMPEPFQLVADDQVAVGFAGPSGPGAGPGLFVSPPPVLAGLIEVRGLGIVTLPHRSNVRLTLLVDLIAGDGIERLPDPWPQESLLGVMLPVLSLAPFEASAPVKLALALAREPWRDFKP